MIGTPAFLLILSLVERLRPIHLAGDGSTVFAFSCALLLLTLLEGAILWRTEIDIGTNVAATPNVPDTAPPDHHPPRRETARRRHRPTSVWTRRFLPQRPIWLGQFSLLRRRRPPIQAPSPRSHLALRLVPDRRPRQDRRSGIFLIPAPDASIASG